MVNATLKSQRRSFKNMVIYLFHHNKSWGKVKDFEHLKVRSLGQVDPDVFQVDMTPHSVAV